MASRSRRLSGPEGVTQALLLGSVLEPDRRRQFQAPLHARAAWREGSCAADLHDVHSKLSGA